MLGYIFYHNENGLTHIIYNVDTGYALAGTNKNSNSKCIYSTHFRYNIILNLINSNNNRFRRHALRHLVSLSYMPPFVFIYYTISIFC